MDTEGGGAQDGRTRRRSPLSDEARPFLQGDYLVAGGSVERCKCGEKQIVRYGAPVETENDVFEWPEEIEEVLC